MFFFGIDTPRPSLELTAAAVVVVVVVVVEESSFVFIDRFSGASSDVVADVLGLPINELTSNANGLPFTVWLRALVPLLLLLLLLLWWFEMEEEDEEDVVVTVVEDADKRNGWAGSPVDFLVEEDRFLSSLDADETDWTAAAMAGGIAKEASGLPKNGYDMAMEESDDKLELGDVEWIETEAEADDSAEWVVGAVRRRFFVPDGVELELLRLSRALLLAVVEVVNSGVVNR